MTFNPAKSKLLFLEKTSLVKIWINNAIRLGQIDLKIRLRVLSDSLIKSILIQNRIRISNAGEGFYYFIT